MTMTDPIADMLTRLRNANQAYHDSVAMPYSKLKEGVAEILKQEGYITSWKVSDNTDAKGEPSTPHSLVRPTSPKPRHMAEAMSDRIQFAPSVCFYEEAGWSSRSVRHESTRPSHHRGDPIAICRREHLRRS